MTWTSLQLQSLWKAIIVFFPLPCLTGIYTREKMSGVFSYESSDIDWCEDNYKQCDYVVEYFNTVSSVTPVYQEMMTLNLIS